MVFLPSAYSSEQDRGGCDCIFSPVVGNIPVYSFPSESIPDSRDQRKKNKPYPHSCLVTKEGIV